MMSTIMDYFPSRVMPEPNSGCWLWTGPMRGPYGACCHEGNQDYAHRFSCALEHGKLNDGDCALHKCDNKICVNPEHLYIGSYSQNVIDAYQRGIMPKGERRSDAKLSEYAVKEIRSYNGMKAPNGFYRRCAEKYGVSYSAVCNAKNGKTWRAS